MKAALKINGKDARAAWGMSLDQKGLSALMTPPPMKDNVKNASRAAHGTQVMRQNARMGARTVNVILQFSARSEEEFWARYSSFCEELKTGFLTIETKYQPGVVYRMEYNSCTQFMEYGRGMAKFNLKLTENDPSDRNP